MSWFTKACAIGLQSDGNIVYWSLVAVLVFGRTIASLVGHSLIGYGEGLVFAQVPEVPHDDELVWLIVNLLVLFVSLFK